MSRLGLLERVPDAHLPDPFINGSSGPSLRPSDRSPNYFDDCAITKDGRALSASVCRYNGRGRCLRRSALPDPCRAPPLLSVEK